MDCTAHRSHSQARAQNDIPRTIVDDPQDGEDLRPALPHYRRHEDEQGDSMNGPSSRTTRGMDHINGGFDELYRKASAVGQKHIFRWWDQLDDRGRSKLIKHSFTCLARNCLRPIAGMA